MPRLPSEPTDSAPTDSALPDARTAADRRRRFRRVAIAASGVTVTLIACQGVDPGLLPWPAGEGGVAQVSEAVDRGIVSEAEVLVASLVNATRTSEGLPTLQYDVELAARARQWAEELARRGRLGHSDLGAQIPPGARLLGENVGRGGDLVRLHSAFLASASHAANIRNPGFDMIGIGVVVVGDTYWVVQHFLGH